MKKTTEFKKIDELINKVETINFIERIFTWKNVKELGIDAAKELGSIDKITESEIQEATQEIRQEKIKLEAKIDTLNKTNLDNIKTITEYETNSKKQQQEYTNRIDDLNKAIAQIEKDRLKLQKDREDEQEEKFKQMREIWKIHERDVEEYLKKICKKQSITYFDKEKVPIKGKPDNTIEIAGQYIIFDAKSPISEDLKSFPQYIKNQAEALKNI